MSMSQHEVSDSDMVQYIQNGVNGAFVYGATPLAH